MTALPRLLCHTRASPILPSISNHWWRRRQMSNVAKSHEYNGASSKWANLPVHSSLIVYVTLLLDILRNVFVLAPSNSISLLCEMNFGEQLSHGGAPLSKAGFNSELKAIEQEYNKHYEAQTDLKTFHSLRPSTGLNTVRRLVLQSIYHHGDEIICLWVIKVFLQKIIFMKSEKQKPFHQDQKIKRLNWSYNTQQHDIILNNIKIITIGKMLPTLTQTQL